MDYKKIIPIILVNQLSAKEIVDTAIDYDESGADELILSDDCESDSFSEEAFISIIKLITSKTDMPLIIRRSFHRLEDVKKVLYAGAAKALISFKTNALSLITEAVGRFGDEKILIGVDLTETTPIVDRLLQLMTINCNNVYVYGASLNGLLELASAFPAINLYCQDTSLKQAEILRLLAPDNVVAFISSDLFATSDDQRQAVHRQKIMELKAFLSKNHLSVNTFISSIDFTEFKLDKNGLIPVITQEYKTGKVLMLAYMNEAAYNETIRSGQMTYYSRSRNELWKKGETSGHYQFVKSLDIDCDYDTILAKVAQIGAACHTGNESCFFTNLIKKEYDDSNPLTIFDKIMVTILNRKENPKEGSYTNYLFDKGIDKILKKVGEEATEIVIAAKNPDDEELKYEISDFLYHLMVLMAWRGLSWKEIAKELAERH